MITFENLWEKLSRSKEYREQFALSFLKRSVSFQIRTLRKKHFGSQAELAERSGLTQGVISRAEDQEYGNLTFNTVGRIAAGLDVAFIGKFVPFSELVRFSQDFSEGEFTSIRTFEEEKAAHRMGPIPVEIINQEKGHIINPQTYKDEGMSKEGAAEMANVGMPPSREVGSLHSLQQRAG